MRVEAYDSVNHIYNNGKKNAGRIVSQTPANDKFEISQSAVSYQVAKQAVASAPDIREDKVLEIKRRMNEGNYYVTSQEVAERIINRMRTLEF